MIVMKLTKQDIIDITRMGCIRDDIGLSEKEHDDYIRKGLKGKLTEDKLAVILPDAVPSVKKNGFIPHFLYFHNLNHKNIEFCIAYPGDIVGKKGDKYEVKTFDGKIIEASPDPYPGIKGFSESELRNGTHVLTHQAKIGKILSDKEYELSTLWFNKYEKDK